MVPGGQRAKAGAVSATKYPTVNIAIIACFILTSIIERASLGLTRLSCKTPDVQYY